MRTTILMVAGLLAVATACSGPSQPSTGGSAPVASVTISPSTIAVEVGKSLQLAATARDSTGNVLSNRKANWSSTDTTISQVSTTGMLSGRKEGGAHVRAEIDGKIADLPVTVNRAAVAVASVALASSNLVIGQTTQASVVLKDAAGNVLTGRTVVWSSSNTAVATVNGSGVVTAAALGTANIIATSENKSGSALLTVAATPPAPVASVVVSLGSTSLTAGQSTQATAVLKDAAGNTLTGRTITWSSTNTTVATVNGSGAVTTAAAGTTNITAISEGKSGFATLTVAAAPPPPVASVTVTLASSSIGVGQTTQATAVLKDASGKVLTGRTITWASTNTAAATVNGSGLVSAVAAGSSSISATSEGKSGAAALTVVASPPPPTVDTIFYDGFESGSLSLWQDGVDPARHHVLTDATAAKGSKYLQITYPAGGDGGWLTRFFMPGYDSVYVRYYVRFPSNWIGSTKLLLLRGSRTDNQWSSFGVAGLCPTGTDWFATNITTLPGGNPGLVRFYTYFPTMAREPDGVTCWGRYSGQGSTTYPDDANTMARGVWHLVEFYVKLNTPGNADAVQRMWIDGVLKGEWTGLSIRSSSILMLNSLTLEASAATESQQRTLDVDDVLVTRTRVTP